ncbi:unnamed protein product, partial [Meganyctiphanes norvegica]
PMVTWWEGSVLLDDISEISQGSYVQNTIHVGPLGYRDLYRHLTCQADNTRLAPPTAHTLTIDMILPPMAVSITEPLRPFTEGNISQFTCEASGSRPAAIITWYKDGRQLHNTRDQVVHEGNTTRSTVSVTLTAADHGNYISCRAQNHKLSSAVLEDSLKLIVIYSPRVSLSAGRSINLEDIKQYDDVYFECNIDANPKPHKVQWFINGDELYHNASGGIILSSNSLVLQRVSRSLSGTFTCIATNQKGWGASNGINLSIKYPPICRGDQRVIYGGGNYEALNVTCSVDALPEPDSFRWAFNGSSEVVESLEVVKWQIGPSVSAVSYTPKSHLDYGTLLCWARNNIGMQLQPCVYHIIHAALPEPVHNCTVSNITSTGVRLHCHEGWDGGMEQTFMLSVSQEQDAAAHLLEKPRVLAYTSNSPKPQFILSQLDSDVNYILTVSAMNKKGQSQPVRIRITTQTGVVGKQISPGNVGLDLSPILAAISSIMAGLLLLIFIIALIVKKTQKKQSMTKLKVTYDKKTPISHKNSESSEEQDPDIIPNKQESKINEMRETSFDALNADEIKKREEQLLKEQRQLQQCLQSNERKMLQQQFPDPRANNKDPYRLKAHFSEKQVEEIHPLESEPLLIGDKRINGGRLNSRNPPAIIKRMNLDSNASHSSYMGFPNYDQTITYNDDSFIPDTFKSKSSHDPNTMAPIFSTMSLPRKKPKHYQHDVPFVDPSLVSSSGKDFRYSTSNISNNLDNYVPNSQLISSIN